MPHLPILNTRGVLAALTHAGFVQKRQNGSHIVLEHHASKRAVVVPNHNPIKRGTLHSIIYQSGLSVEEFIELL